MSQDIDTVITQQGEQTVLQWFSCIKCNLFHLRNMCPEGCDNCGDALLLVCVNCHKAAIPSFRGVVTDVELNSYTECAANLCDDCATAARFGPKCTQCDKPAKFLYSVKLLCEDHMNTQDPVLYDCYIESTYKDLSERCVQYRKKVQAQKARQLRADNSKILRQLAKDNKALGVKEPSGKAVKVKGAKAKSVKAKGAKAKAKPSKQ